MYSSLKFNDAVKIELETLKHVVLLFKGVNWCSTVLRLSNNRITVELNFNRRQLLLPLTKHCYKTHYFCDNGLVCLSYVIECLFLSQPAVAIHILWPT